MARLPQRLRRFPRRGRTAIVNVAAAVAAVVTIGDLGEASGHLHRPWVVWHFARGPPGLAGAAALKVHARPGAGGTSRSYLSLPASRDDLDRVLLYLAVLFSRRLILLTVSPAVHLAVVVVVLSTLLEIHQLPPPSGLHRDVD